MVLGGVQAQKREAERLQQLSHRLFMYSSGTSPSKSLQFVVKMRRSQAPLDPLHQVLLCTAHPPIPAHPQDKTRLAKPLPIQPFITRDRFPILTEQAPAINEFIFHHLDADGFLQEPQGHQSFINRHCKSI